MRKGRIVGRFGEDFIALLMTNLGFDVDLIDAEGIDLMCYKDEGNISYGVSVKTRNIQENSNDSINLKWNDIVYTAEETEKRGAKVPVYAFVITHLERIDIFVFTQEYMFKHYFAKKGIENIEEYRQKYANKEVCGSTQGIDTGNKAKNSWVERYENHEEGVIFAASYKLS